MLQRTLPVVALVGVFAALTACVTGQDANADSVDATAALPAPGTMPDDFSYPAVIGPPVTKEMLMRRPTVLALWSWRAPGHVVPMREFDSLTKRFAMPGYLRFVVIADRERGAELDSAIRAAPWANQVESIGAGAGNIPIVFDQSLRAAAQKRAAGGPRIEFRMPSFLLLDENARVVRRVAGRPYAALSPALDSIKTLFESRQSSGDTSLAREMRPRIDAALAGFDPTSLRSRDTTLRLDGTCDGKEPIPMALVPARGRVVEIQAARPSIHTVIELVSVALGRPESGSDVCGARRIVLTPGIRVDTLRLRFDEFAMRDSSVARIASGALRERNDDGPRRFALIDLSSQNRLLVFPAGATAAELRARIDSVRRGKSP